MKKLLMLGMSIWSVCLLAGCETVKGVGKDITNAGSSVQRSFSR